MEVLPITALLVSCWRSKLEGFDQRLTAISVQPQHHYRSLMAERMLAYNRMHGNGHDAKHWSGSGRKPCA